MCYSKPSRSSVRFVVLSIFAFATLPLVVKASTNTSRPFHIVLSNDDGWAELNIRTTYDALIASNNSVLISAPAVDQTGESCVEEPPWRLKTPGEYDSIPAGADAIGFNQSHPAFWYVNSYPATAIEIGLTTLGPAFFGSKIDLAVSGVDVGSNMGFAIPVSGTIGAARKAAKLGYPSIAFSGKSGHHSSWHQDPVPASSSLYAALTAKFVNIMKAHDGPYMEPHTLVNVNYPHTHRHSDGKIVCTHVDDFDFILTASSKINSRIVHHRDEWTCGTTTLPRDEHVVDRKDGCYVSVTVMNHHLDNGNATQQAVVKEALRPLLKCLPDARSDEL